MELDEAKNGPVSAKLLCPRGYLIQKLVAEKHVQWYVHLVFLKALNSHCESLQVSAARTQKSSHTPDLQIRES